MQRLVAPILAAWRRRRRTDDGADVASPTRSCRSAADTARALSRAIDDAVAAGHTSRAWRIAESAERLVETSPRLAERIARLHLARGDTAAALECIESCRTHGASLRLLRAICLVRAGRPGDAHLDLHRWAGRSIAPLEARVLLAMLEWKAGRRDAARAALRRNLRQIEDPTSLAMLLTMAAGTDDREATATLVRRLRRATTCTPVRDEVELIIQSLALPAPRSLTEPSPYLAQSLAAELVTAEPLIPSLVEAQRIEPNLEAIELLVRALRIARNELVAPVTAVLALAELELLRDRPKAARELAREALQHSPMSAAAALLVQQANTALYGLVPAGKGGGRERAA